MAVKLSFTNLSFRSFVYEGHAFMQETTLVYVHAKEMRDPMGSNSVDCTV